MTAQNEVGPLDDGCRVHALELWKPPPPPLMVNVTVPVGNSGMAVLASATVAVHWKYSLGRPGLSLSHSTSVADGRLFVVDGTKGEHVCITVTVNREGKLGSASSPKCVDVGG